MPGIVEATKRIEAAAKTPKLKEFRIDPVTLSEFAFIQTQKRASEEISAFWNIRLEEMMMKTRKRLAIPAWYEVQWDELFAKEVIHVLEKPEPKPPEAKVESKTEPVKEPAKEPEKKEDHAVPAA